MQHFVVFLLQSPSKAVFCPLRASGALHSALDTAPEEGSACVQGSIYGAGGGTAMRPCMPVPLSLAPCSLHSAAAPCATHPACLLCVSSRFLPMWHMRPGGSAYKGCPHKRTSCKVLQSHAWLLFCSPGSALYCPVLRCVLLVFQGMEVDVQSAGICCGGSMAA